MKRDWIREIAIDEAGRLHVVPATHTFAMVYREGLEVHWDTARHSLHSPPPRQWSYLQWFEHMRATARAQGCELRINPDTRWVNIEPGLQSDIQHLARPDTGLE